MEYLKKERGYLTVTTLVMPVIMSVIIPLVILDFWIEVYHRICFWAYKIPYVKRGSYIKIDRHKLQYLTFPQKIFCMYCSYANGIFTYWTEIGGRTEKHWCGIKHKQSPEFIAPKHHEQYAFAEYGDEDKFKQKYIKK